MDIESKNTHLAPHGLSTGKVRIRTDFLLWVVCKILDLFDVVFEVAVMFRINNRLKPQRSVHLPLWHSAKYVFHILIQGIFFTKDFAVVTAGTLWTPCKYKHVVSDIPVGEKVFHLLPNILLLR